MAEWRPPPWAGGIFAGREVGINSPFGPICIEPIGKYAMFIVKPQNQRFTDQFVMVIRAWREIDGGFLFFGFPDP